MLAAAVVLLSLAAGVLGTWRTASGLKQPETVSVAEEPSPGLPDPAVQEVQCPDCADLIVQIRQWRQEMQARQKDRDARLDAAWEQQQIVLERTQDAQAALTQLEEEVGRLMLDIQSWHMQQEESVEKASDDPVSFVFRGTEVWGGQVYALLEHEGRVFTARKGDTRLGWRVLSIDRAAGQLRVGQGQDEVVLEEQ